MLRHGNECFRRQLLLLSLEMILSSVTISSVLIILPKIAVPFFYPPQGTIQSDIAMSRVEIDQVAITLLGVSACVCLS